MPYRFSLAGVITTCAVPYEILSYKTDFFKPRCKNGSIRILDRLLTCWAECVSIEAPNFQSFYSWFSFEQTRRRTARGYTCSCEAGVIVNETEVAPGPNLNTRGSGGHINMGTFMSPYEDIGQSPDHVDRGVHVIRPSDPRY